MNTFRRSSHLWVLVLCLAGCHVASSGAYVRETLSSDPGWVGVDTVEPLQQTGEADCGDMTAAMVLEYWGRPGDPVAIRAASGEKAGVGLSAGFLRDHLRTQGLQAFLVEGTSEDLNRELQAGRPVIVGLARPTLGGGAMAHYALVVGIHRGRDEVLLLDPDGGGRRRKLADFRSTWTPTRSLMIVAMLPGR